MNIQIYRRKNPESSRAIILPNRLTGGHKDDLGVRALKLAEVTRLPVIAYERPGTASSPAVKPYTPDTLRGSMIERAEELGELAKKEGFCDLAAVGHSAAGSEVILLAETEILPIVTVISFDPLMMCSRAMERSARVGWLKHQARATLKEMVGGGNTPLPGNSMVTSAKYVIKEGRAYQDVLFGDMAISAVKNIAQSGTTKTYITVGEKSGILDTLILAEEFAGLPNTYLEVIPGADHGFAEPIDDHARLAARHIES